MLFFLIVFVKVVIVKLDGFVLIFGDVLIEKIKLICCLVKECVFVMNIICVLKYVSLIGNIWDILFVVIVGGLVFDFEIL